MNNIDFKNKKVVRNNFIVSIIRLLLMISFIIMTTIIIFKVFLPVINSWNAVSRGINEVQNLVSISDLNSNNFKNVINEFYLQDISDVQISKLKSLLLEYQNILNNKSDNKFQELNFIINDISEQIDSFGVLSQKGTNFLLDINNANDSLLELNDISKNWFNLNFNEIINQTNFDFNDLLKENSSNLFKSKIFYFSIVLISLLAISIIISVYLFISSFLFIFKNKQSDNDLKFSLIFLVFNLIFSFWIIGNVFWIVIFILWIKKWRRYDLKKEQKKWQGW